MRVMVVMMVPSQHETINLREPGELRQSEKIDWHDLVRG